MMTNNNFSVRGNFIYTENEQFESGYILIKGEKISNFIDDSEQNQKILEKKLKKYPLKFDFKNLFITPGGVDLNVSLNLLHTDQQFVKTQFFTCLSAMGGVTTIINNPSHQIGYQFQKYQENKLLQEQLKILQQNSFADYGQLSHFNESTLNDIKKMKEIGAIGFRMYLSPQPQLDQKTYFKDYSSIRNALLQIQSQKESYTLFIHTQSMQEKDLMITSPLRRLRLDFRLNQYYQLKNEATDGLKGNIDSDEEMVLNEEQVIFLEKKLLENSLDANSFHRLSKYWTKKTQYELLSRAEELQYMKQNDEENYKFKQLSSIQSNERCSLSSKRNIDFSDLIQQKNLYFEQFNCMNQLEFRQSQVMFDQRQSQVMFGQIEKRGPQKQNTLIKNSFNSGLEGDKEIQFDSEESENEREKQSHQTINNEKLSSIINILLLCREGIINCTTCQGQYFDKFNEQVKPDDIKPLIETVIKKRKLTLVVYCNNSICYQRFAISLQKVSERSLELNRSIDSMSNEDRDEQDKCRVKDLKYFQDYQFFLAFRPSLWEIQAVSLITKAFGIFSQRQRKKQQLNFLEIPQLSLIFTNLSDALTISYVNRLRDYFPRVFCDIGYPYIYFDNQYIKDKVGYSIIKSIQDIRFKSDPPIRKKKNKKLLIYAVNQNWVTSLSSSHYFASEQYKNTTNQGDFRRAVSGLNSMGINIPVIWTIEMMKIKQQYNYSSRELCDIFYQNTNQYVKKEIEKSVQNLVRFLCTGPAESVNIVNKKGRIKKGLDADLVVWNPFDIFEFDLEAIIENSNLQEKLDSHCHTHVFHQRKFYGGVVMTILRGKQNYERQEKKDGEKRKFFHIFHRVQGINIA